MLIPGLVSVTFRPLAPERICTLAREANLSLLEWGGDIHVPSGDFATARKVRELTDANGLRSSSYGSYYRCTENAEEARAILQTAEVLGAGNIRVWAGQSGSADTSPEARQSVADAIRALCTEAAPRGITVSTEFHQGTLTDHWESAVRLAEEVERDNFRLYWQPNQFRDHDYNVTALRRVLPHLSGVHVFHWLGRDKFPLSDGERFWRDFLDILADSEHDHPLYMEFVADDTEEQFRRDAETLHRWLGK